MKQKQSYTNATPVNGLPPPHSISWHVQTIHNHGNVATTGKTMPMLMLEHICLAATEQGLGTCWVCAFDAALCKKLFDMPEHIEPIALIPIGYPADEAKEKNRKATDEIVEKL